MIKKIDHIAIAVTDLDAEIDRYKNILGLEFLGTEVVEEQKVKVAFFNVGGVFIELTAPISDDSPISKFIEKKGSGIHHLAYEVEDIRAAMDELKSKGIQMLGDEPRKGAHDAQIIFAHPKSLGGVLVELKQKKGE